MLGGVVKRNGCISSQQPVTKTALAHCTSYNVLKFTSFTAITCVLCISLSPISADFLYTLYGLSADNHSSIAALDTFSTVFELPLYRTF